MPPAHRFPSANRRAFLLVLLVATIAITSSIGIGAEPKPATVQLVVDYGDGVQVHFTALSWRTGMTVLDALTAAQKHAHGITFSYRGSGSSAMITKIGDLKNEGDGKNWLYEVNGKPAEISAGILELKAGDAVLWKFQVYDYNS